MNPKTEPIVKPKETHDSQFQAIDSLDAVIELTHQATSQTLFIFDAVCVLIKFNDLIVRPCGLESFRKLMKELQKSHEGQLIQGKTRKMLLSEFLEGRIIENLLTISCDLLDKRIPAFIAELSRRNIKAIALSAGKVGRYADYESMADCRVAQLKGLGVQFAASFPQLKVVDLAPHLPKKPNTAAGVPAGAIAAAATEGGMAPIYKEGVILTARHSKGEALSALFDAAQWVPTEVIMVDDQIRWLKDIEMHMNARGINFRGFHLQHKEFAADRANEELFNFQFDHLKKYHIWLNDKPALALLRQKKLGLQPNDPEKEMILLFLDIDGVLLNLAETTPIFEIFLKAIKEGDIAKLKEMGVDRFSKSALDCLHKLIAAIEQKGYQCSIVISSSWRKKLSVEAFKSLFKDHKFSEYIIDKTADKAKLSIKLAPELETYKLVFKRAESIEEWLKANERKYKIAKILILDDVDDGLSELFAGHFVHCREGVFSDSDFKAACELLTISENRISTDLPLNDLTALEVREEGPTAVVGTNVNSPQALPMRISSQHRQEMILPLFKLLLNHVTGAVTFDAAQLIVEYDMPQRVSFEERGKPAILQFTPKALTREEFDRQVEEGQKRAQVKKQKAHVS